MNIKYDWCLGTVVNSVSNYDSLINECSELYSEHYGRWGVSAPAERIGKRVKLSPDKIRQWLSSEESSIYWAKDEDKLVGYAIAIQVQVKKYGVISWVTQLVVHQNYRNNGIAKALLTSIWGFSDHFAWGIVSANPYAIRALETTTRRRAIPLRIKNNLKKIVLVGAEHIPYIDTSIETVVNKFTSKINTNFPIDHSEVGQMLEDVISPNIPWELGELDEGWEWLAFTFNDQIPFALGEAEIKRLLDTANQIAKKAYGRMDYSLQPWAKNTSKEIDFIISQCHLNPGDLVFDFGCGSGRHAVALAERGMRVVGIDYVEKHIKEANKLKEEKRLDQLSFICGDCKSEILHGERAKAILCLYDVVGSFVDNNSNQEILHNIYRHLMDDGTALISVMNYELTKANAKYKFSITKNPNELLNLKPSTIQGETGDIFNGEYYLLETDSQGIIYRREQFNRGHALPIELIVRDRRFTSEEIEGMCRLARLEVEFCRYVNSGGWSENRNATDKHAKEILLKCHRQNIT